MNPKNDDNVVAYIMIILCITEILYHMKILQYHNIILHHGTQRAI